MISAEGIIDFLKNGNAGKYSYMVDGKHNKELQSYVMSNYPQINYNTVERLARKHKSVRTPMQRERDQLKDHPFLSFNN